MDAAWGHCSRTPAASMHTLCSTPCKIACAPNRLQHAGTFPCLVESEFVTCCVHDVKVHQQLAFAS